MQPLVLCGLRCIDLRLERREPGFWVMHDGSVGYLQLDHRCAIVADINRTPIAGCMVPDKAATSDRRLNEA